MSAVQQEQFPDVVRRMRLVLLLALAPTLLFLCIQTPPFWVADEPAHYLRANGLTHGSVLPMRVMGPDHKLAAGGLTDSGASSFIAEAILSVPEKELRPTSRAAILRAAQRRYSDQPAATPYSNTAIYPPLLYLPEGAAVGVVRLLRGPQLIGFYAGRITNCLLAIFILWRLIGRAGRLAPFVVAAASVPIAMFETASLSADSLLSPIAVAFACSLAALRQESSD